MDDLGINDASDESIIAIVGMACHFPGAGNISEYWDNLLNGVESVSRFSNEELLAAGESPKSIADPNYVNAQPFLKDFDRFDAKFWGFSPQDAAVTDPAHRIFMEVAYQSLEHAGHTGYDSEGTVGVFASSGASQYWMENLNTNPQLIDEMGEFLVRHTGNDMNFLATRLSYELDLRGPSLNIQTACSSALVAVHMGVQSLLGGECDTAIVGGSTVLLPQGRGYLYRDGEIMSPDGHCRPFDAKSAGTIFGSGAGAVVLRRLEDALEDGDTIYALIRGSAINNDGAQKVGYLAPGVEGQAGAVSEALEISGIDAADVSYIEAHGTGTLVGDPIEFEALNQVYREATTKRNYCGVGSVKSNIGHLGEAAGAAALIKVVLSLQNKKIPASINYDSPNPDIELEDSPFFINNSLRDWQGEKGGRIAGVTALGAGGTNAHVIVAEPLDTEELVSSHHSKQLLVVSAKTETALKASCRNLARLLHEQPDIELADVAFTLQVGRRAYDHRKVLAADDREEAIFLLEGGDDKRVAQDKAEDKDPSLVLMFPGGGAQYAGMGAELYSTEVTYRQAFDDCLAVLAPALAEEIKSLVFATEQLEEASKKMEMPSRTLPSLFATEYALAKQLMFWGAEPTAFIGHSMGEYTAACLSGVISVKDAMNLVHLRGQLFEKNSMGGMLSISLPEADARRHMSDNLDIAAVNAPDFCVASGPVEDIERLQLRLEEQEVDCTRVRIDVAAHSSMLDVVLEEFSTFCHSINFSSPKIPFTSNLSGGWITDKQATDPDYWVQHLRNTVRFADNIATVLEDDTRVLVEVGPGRTLTNLAQAGGVQAKAIFNAMRHANEVCSDVEYALRTYGKMWAAGVNHDWTLLWVDERRRRVALPTYPFERKTYWVEPGKQKLAFSSERSLGKLLSIDDWFGRLSWAQSTCSASIDALPNAWLVFDDELGLSDRVCGLLQGKDNSARLIRVTKGLKFLRKADNEFELNPENCSDFESLFEIFAAEGFLPQSIIYMWAASAFESKSSREILSEYDTNLKSSFWGLFNLSKVLSESDAPVRLTAITNDMQALVGSGSPDKSLVLGPINVLPHEVPNIETQSIDISLSGSQKKDVVGVAAERIVRELCSDCTDRHIAYRGLDRWVRCITSSKASHVESNKPWMHKGGTYLITGGLGGVGLTIARELAEQGAATLMLIGRNGLPERSDWQSWLDSHVEADITSQRIRQVLDIEHAGANVLCTAADVTNYQSFSTSVEKLISIAGKIDGVIHAAGVMDDQLIIEKTEQSAKKVIESKIKGALILDSIFDNKELEFFVVFSSVASYLGLPGQVDYTAANAFLDAFAIERSGRAEGQTIAINWNAWQEVGMAVNAQREENYREKLLEKKTANHPSFDYFTSISDNKKLFVSNFSSATDWLISEHKVKNGEALIPGTGFIELFRSAFEESCIEEIGTSAFDDHYIELFDVQFLEAFIVTKDTERELFVGVSGNAKNASLSIYSGSDEVPHALASARLISCSKAENYGFKVNLDEILTRCIEPAPTAGHYLDQDFMEFGPRWGCIQSIHHSSVEALLVIELKDEFINDLKGYQLHPAMLDMALGGAQFLIEGFSKNSDFYVPVSYQKLQVFKPMPQKILSHVGISDNTPEGFATFDVSLFDDTGTPVATVFGFTMKKVAPDFAVGEASRSTAEGLAENALSNILKEAITPKEGAKAFFRVMGQNQQAQWIVSSVNTALWLQQLDTAEIETPERISYIKEVIHDPDADPDIPVIESALVSNAGIQAIVVRSFLDEGGERRLVAFYEIDWDSNITVSELRQFAREVLEEDKVPLYYIEHDELPLTDNGEICKEELKDPLVQEEQYISPRTPAEKVMAIIWQDVLGVSRVSLSDNFYDIGGHSLLSIRVIVRAEKKLGVRLDQAALALQTLEQLAKEVEVRSAPEISDSGSDAVNQESNSKSRLKSWLGRKK